MVVRFDLEFVEDVMIGIAHGPLTLDEIKEAAAAMWQRATGPQIRVLWDLRDAHFVLDTAEVRDFAEFAKQLAGSTAIRSAFVVSGDLEYGLLRMFAVFREVEGALAAVFRHKVQAVEWLTSEAVVPNTVP